MHLHRLRLADNAPSLCSLQQRQSLQRDTCFVETRKRACRLGTAGGGTGGEEKGGNVQGKREESRHAHHHGWTFSRPRMSGVDRSHVAVIASSMYQPAVFSVIREKKNSTSALWTITGTRSEPNKRTAKCCASIWTSKIAIRCTSWFARFLCVALNCATSASDSQTISDRWKSWSTL